MDTNNILTAISTVGFPIVACAAMFWQNHENQKAHKEESDKWVSVLSANTVAIQRLSDLLEGMTNDRDN